MFKLGAVVHLFLQDFQSKIKFGRIEISPIIIVALHIKFCKGCCQNGCTACDYLITVNYNGCIVIT